jgi:hypothetical protein
MVPDFQVAAACFSYIPPDFNPSNSIKLKPPLLSKPSRFRLPMAKQPTNDELRTHILIRKTLWVF